MTAARNLDRVRAALAAFDGEIVAIGGRRGARVLSLAHALSFGKAVPDSDICAALVSAARIEGHQRGIGRLPSSAGRSVAFVPVCGVAVYNVEAQPFCFSTALLAQRMDELAADPAVSAIVLDIDSPGGIVTGTPEAADAVFRARKAKPVVASINPLCASAAYWIASQASHITTISSGDVGSIGVFVAHVNESGLLERVGLEVTFIANQQSPHKTEGNSAEPLKPATRDHYQQEVDALGRQFIASVARGRGVPSGVVERDFGRGRTVTGRDAFKLGMIDAIGGTSAAFDAAMNPAGLRAARLRALAEPTAQELAAMERRRRLEVLRHG